MNIKDDYDVLEKTIMVDDKEISAWKMYCCCKYADVKGFPSYEYIEYNLYLYETIFSPDIYSEVFHIIRNTSLGDIINIYINSPGGDINTLIAFSSVFENCEASIICHVDGEASSAAFIIAFMGDEILISEFAQLMAHNQQIGTQSLDMANLMKYARISTDIYRSLLVKYCSKVLSDEEIKAICESGLEVHLSASECIKRLERWKKEHEEEE